MIEKPDYRYKTTDKFLHQRKIRLAKAIESIIPVKVSGLGLDTNNQYRGTNGIVNPNDYVHVGYLNLIDRPMNDDLMTLNSKKKLFKKYKEYNVIGLVYGDITYLYINNNHLYVLDKNYSIIKENKIQGIDLWDYSFYYQNKLRK